MRISRKLKQFLHEYEQYFRHVLKPTHDEIKNYLKQLEGSALWNLYTTGNTTVNPSPIKMTLIRIKRPEAIVDKISRRPDEFSDGLSSKSLKKMYEELLHHWDAVKHENTDMLSSENLPEVLAEIGIQCSLMDLYDILKLLSSRGIITVGDFFAVATPERIKTIWNTYLSSAGRAPG